MDPKDEQAEQIVQNINNLEHEHFEQAFNEQTNSQEEKYQQMLGERSNENDISDLQRYGDDSPVYIKQSVNQGYAKRSSPTNSRKINREASHSNQNAQHSAQQIVEQQQQLNSDASLPHPNNRVNFLNTQNQIRNNTNSGQVIMKQRQTSPNRYFSTGETININQNSRSIIPPHNPMLVSFGGFNKNVNQPIIIKPATPIIQTQNNMQYSVSSRSRVISQASGKQTLIIPGNVPLPLQITSQAVKPQSSIIARTDRVSPSPPHLQHQTIPFQTHYRSQIRQQPISTNNSFTLGSNNYVKSRSPTKQQITFNQALGDVKNLSYNGKAQVPYRSQRSFSHMDSNSQIRPWQIGQGVQPSSKTISVVPSGPIQSFQHIAPPNSAKVLAIEQWHIETVTKYISLSSKVQSITQSANQITELISIMMKGEQDQQKQEFIKNLLFKQTKISQKLIEASKQSQEVINKSNQLQTQILPSQKTINQGSDSANDEKFQQLQKIKKELQIMQQNNSNLRTTIQKLKKQNSEFKNKYDSLQQSELSSGKLSIEDELTKTIQSQKIMIKKLEQQLIQVHNQSSAQNIKRLESLKDDTQSNKLQLAYQAKRKVQQQKLLTIIQSKKAYINELQAEIIRYKTQIKNLKQIIKEKDRNERNFSLPIIEEKPTSFELELISKKLSVDSSQVSKLQKIISDKDIQLDQVKLKIFQIQQQFDKTIDEKNDKIKELLQQIINLNKKDAHMGLQPPSNRVSEQSLPSFNGQSSKPIVASTKHENDKQRKQIKTVNSLEDQISNRAKQLIQKNVAIPEQVQIELQKLKTILSQKDDQLQKLNSATQKKKELEAELTTLKNQTFTLKESLKIKGQQKERLLQSLNNLELKFKDLGQVKNENETAQKNMSIMLQTIKKKQSQIIKMRQTIGSHVQNIQGLQNQIKELTEKYKEIEQGLIEERKLTSQKSIEYQEKLKEFEAKAHEKELKTHQHDVNKLKSTIKQLKKRIKQLQQKQNSEGQRVSDVVAFGDDQDFRKHYSQSQVKIFELQTAVKNKQNKIKQLESNLQMMKIKVGSKLPQEQEFMNQQQIQTLRRKIAEYEYALSNKNNESLMKAYKARDYNSIHVFEQKVIYDLKSENQRLRSMLGGNLKSTVKHGKWIKNNQQYVEVIQERLHQFNKRLQDIILQNKQIEIRGEKSSSANNQLMGLFERQKLVILRKHKKQIQALQSRIVDLQRYCSSLQNFQSHSISNVFNQKQAIIEKNNVFDDQVAYYKQKNKQLEERVDSLLKLDKQLKQKYEKALKGGEKVSNQYYTQQISILEGKILDYEGKIKLLTQSFNKNLKQLQQWKNNRSKDEKILSLQATISQLTNKVQRLQLQRKSLDNQLQNYANQILTASTQSLNIKASMSEKQQKIHSLQNMLKNYNNKAINYEQKSTKDKNQVEILKAEIERLNQLLSNKKIKQQNQVGQLQRTIERLQQQLRQLKAKAQGWDTQRFNNNANVNALNSKYLSMEASYKLEIQKSNSLNQRISDLQNRLNSLQTQIRQTSDRNYNLKLDVEDRDSQIATLTKWVNQLKQQKQSSQNKQNNAIIQYQVQLIRSVFIEFDVLLSQLFIKEEHRQRQILVKFRDELQKGFKACEQIYTKL